MNVVIIKLLLLIGDHTTYLKHYKYIDLFNPIASIKRQLKHYANQEWIQKLSVGEDNA